MLKLVSFLTCSFRTILKKISQLEGIHKSISTAWELSHLKNFRWIPNRTQIWSLVYRRCGVASRVTANFLKSGPKILKFCTGGLVACLHRMKSKKSSRIFHAYAKRDFLRSQKPHPQISWNFARKLKILSTFRYTIWKVAKMTDKGFLTDKQLIKLKFYW